MHAPPVKDRTRTEHVARVARTIFTQPDGPFSIVELHDGHTAVGPADAEAFEAGHAYRFLGRWEDDPKRGPRFKFTTYALHEVLGRRGVVRYLCDTCAGIGPAKAAKLYDEFGGGTLDVLRDDPARVAQVTGFDAELCREASASLRLAKGAQDTKVALFDLFAGKGFSGKLIDAAIRKWGAQAPAMIRRNPFNLLGMPSAGFKRCDKLWAELGLPPDAMKRQVVTLGWLAGQSRDGHTWLKAQDLSAALLESIPRADFIKAIKIGLRARTLAKRRDGEGQLWLAPYGRAAAEADVARHLMRLMAGASLWPAGEVSPSGCDGDGLPSAHQVGRLRLACSSAVGVLCGGPGTGKTFTLAAMLRTLVANWGRSAVAVCAPTGKAAVRASQALKLAGLDLATSTIHGLLQIEKAGYGSGDWGFFYTEANPLPYRFIIIDEMSMVDTSLMNSLLKACANGSQVLMIGDTGQLPPVGHGAPLRDIIAANIPTGELTEVRRNAGRIVHACAAIKANTAVTFSDSIDLESQPPENLKHIHAKDEAAAQVVLTNLLTRMTKFHPVKQCQVIVGRNAARTKINDELQQLLNPDGVRAKGNSFRVGDKVICTRNGWQVAVEPVGTFAAGYEAESLADPRNYQPVQDDTDDNGRAQNRETYVANGEIGFVAAVSESLTIARFSEGDTLVKIPMGKGKDFGDDDADGGSVAGESGGRGCNVDLAYAVTCHKCVHPDTLVETTEGLLPIRLIADAGQVATPFGTSPYPVKFVNPAAKALRIVTEHGYEITVTPDHGVESWDVDAWKRYEAHELKPGNWLRLRLGVTTDVADFAPLPGEPSHHNKAVVYKLPREVTPDVAEFLGLMVADGTVFRTGFRLVKRHEDVLKRFDDLCRQLFNCSPVAMETEGTPGYEVSSTYLAEWLRSIGGLCPNAKGIPECVLRSPLVCQEAFLRGLFEDGTVNLKNGVFDHIEWTTAYPEMAKTVHTMLLRSGVFAKLTTRKSGAWSYAVVYIYEEAASVFRDRIGFIAAFKQGRLLPCKLGSAKALLPADRSLSRELRKSVSKSAGDNLLTRGYVSRTVARAAGLHEELNWFHSRIKSISVTECPSMCVEVPDGSRFLQNGFPFWNCQGSEAPCVIVMVDAGSGLVASREWHYTAISRASKLCVVVGDRAVFDRQRAKQSGVRRKTFLAEILTEKTGVPS